MSKNPKPKSDAPHGGNPHPTHDTGAEQAREAQESAKAENAEASIRERMVKIGRANQQTGRHTKQ